MYPPAGRPTAFRRRRHGALMAPLIAVMIGLFGAACAGEDGQPATPVVPGTAASPREVNLITRDYAFIPGSLDLVPGETVVLHVVNAGLVVHEAVIGDKSAQDAWEAAEAAVAGAPPGPTPLVSVPPDVAGIRVVVRSGERVDVTFTVPEATGTSWFVGCHIPGHLDKGMQIPVRWIAPSPATSPSAG